VIHQRGKWLPGDATDVDNEAQQYDVLVYGITKGDGSGYNRMVWELGTKSKVKGVIE
jgi:hypothetical protein